MPHFMYASNGIKYGKLLYLVLFVIVLYVPTTHGDEKYKTCLPAMGAEGTMPCVQTYVKEVNEALSWKNLLDSGVQCSKVGSLLTTSCTATDSEDIQLIKDYQEIANECWKVFEDTTAGGKGILAYTKAYDEQAEYFRKLDLSKCEGIDDKKYRQFEKELKENKNQDQFISKNFEFCCYVQTQMYCYENLVITEDSPLHASLYMKLLTFSLYKYSKKMESCDKWNERAKCNSGVKLNYNVRLGILCVVIQYLIKTFYFNM